MTKRQALKKAKGRTPSGWLHSIWVDTEDTSNYMYWFRDENSSLLDSSYVEVIASCATITEKQLDEYLKRASIA